MLKKPQRVTLTTMTRIVKLNEWASACKSGQDWLVTSGKRASNATVVLARLAPSSLAYANEHVAL